MKYLFIALITVASLSSCEVDSLPGGYYNLHYFVMADENSEDDFFMADTYRIGSNNEPMVHYRSTIDKLVEEFGDKYEVTVQLDSISHYWSYGEIAKEVHEIAIFKLQK